LGTLIDPCRCNALSRGGLRSQFITNTTGDARLLDSVMLFPDPGESEESDSELESTSNSEGSLDDSGNESLWE
jgi:hypothetical protein